MIGYKVFNADWKCIDFQYEVGKIYELDGKPVCCKKGFHFCKKLKDCFNYYDFNSKNKVAIVEALGDIDSEGDNPKHCTNKIKIVKELSWEEVLRLVNLGVANSGNCNSGNRNSGNCNSGNWNSGNRNSGNRNSGDWNSGSCNSGNWNSGNRNSGNRNSGNCNSGDWNITDYSNGCFNTKEPKIFIFNKISDLTYTDWKNSHVKYLLNTIPTNNLEWIWESSMTEKEKENNNNYKTTGGYLKSNKVTKEDRQKWFDNLSEYNKNLIFNIPNFDADIFEKITGIKITSRR